jgi:SOS-response transcriptional repressor LexA
MSDGSDLVNRIKSVKEIKSVSADTGISVSTISDWKKRGNLPSADKLAMIAKSLGVTIDWLLTGVDPEGLSEDARDIVTKYQMFDELDQEETRAFINTKINIRYVEPTKTSFHRGRRKHMHHPSTMLRLFEPDTPDTETLNTHGIRIGNDVKILKGGMDYVPFYGKSAAGIPIDMNGEPTAMVLFPREVLLGNITDYFAIEISGTSMIDANINDGDMALIRRTEYPTYGKINLVRYQDQSTVKRVIKEENGDTYLCWEDGSDTRIRVDSQDYAVLGVVERIAKLPE